MYSINTGENNFKIEPIPGKSGKGKINDQEYSMDMLSSGSEIHVLRDNRSYRIFVVSADYQTKTFELQVNGKNLTVQGKDKFDLLLQELGMENIAGAAVNDLKAPMPGMVLRIEVSTGQEVKKGDPLIVLEAMKMENVLKASSDAVVNAVHAEVGKAVNKNQVLIEFG